MPMPTDTQLLDWLERQNRRARFSGRCIVRVDDTGWAITESEDPDAHTTVRAAIAAAMDEAGEE